MKRISKPGVVRGYKVIVTYRRLSADERRKQGEVARILARSILRQRQLPPWGNRP